MGKNPKLPIGTLLWLPFIIYFTTCIAAICELALIPTKQVSFTSSYSRFVSRSVTNTTIVAMFDEFPVLVIYIVYNGMNIGAVLFLWWYRKNKDPVPGAARQVAPRDKIPRDSCFADTLFVLESILSGIRTALMFNLTMMMSGQMGFFENSTMFLFVCYMWTTYKFRRFDQKVEAATWVLEIGVSVFCVMFCINFAWWTILSSLESSTPEGRIALIGFVTLYMALFLWVLPCLDFMCLHCERSKRRRCCQGPIDDTKNEEDSVLKDGDNHPEKKYVEPFWKVVSGTDSVFLWSEVLNSGIAVGMLLVILNAA